MRALTMSAKKLTPKKRLVFLFDRALHRALSHAEKRELSRLMQVLPGIEVWRLLPAPQALQ